MNVGTWGVVLVVGYCLFQLPAVASLVYALELDPDGLPHPAAGYRTYDARTSPAAGARCDACGEPNDPAYRRCRACASRLQHRG